MEEPYQAAAAPALTPPGAHCKQCGYALQGLDPAGVCPECGFTLERSLTDDLLRNSSSEYLALLHRGVFLVLAGIIAQFLMIIGGFAGAIFLGVNGVNMASLELALTLMSLVGTVMIAWGWFEFSTPDPAFTGRSDGSQARVVVRVAVIINAFVTLVTGVAQFAFPAAGVAPGAVPTTVSAASVVLVVLSLIGFVAWAVSFFAAMLYLKWLCPRIPNWRAWRRARTLMWLGPLLFTVGALCIGLGPLVAIVLYWNLLDWIRRDLKRIRQEQSELGLA